MALEDELGRAARAAAEHGPVSGVLAADTATAGRAYLVALGLDDARSWLVLDAEGVVVPERERVREVASLVILCELAAELADELAEEMRRRSGEEDLRASAVEALAQLDRVVGQPPRLASAAYLDRVGEAARGAERARGELSSPLAAALAAYAPAVEAFVAEVEDRQRVPLR
jgi:hypothetical protein